MPASAIVFASALAFAAARISAPNSHQRYSSSPQLSLAQCTAGAPSQMFGYDATNQSILLIQNGYCIDILAYGTTPGSEAYTAPCHHDDRDPTHQNQNFTEPTATPQGSLIIEMMSGLALDISGDAVPNALIVLGPGALFFSRAGALVHVNSGLCVDAGPWDPYLGGPTANLRACDDSRLPWQIISTVNGAFELTTPDLQTGSPVCLTRAMAIVGDQLGVMPCEAGAATQSFTFDDATGQIMVGNSSLSVVAAASSGGAYEGLPVLIANSTPANEWTNKGTAGAARFVHSSGLCLDLGRLPWGHGCVDPTQRELPYCDATQTVAARVADLLGRLTLKEKVALTGSGLWSNGAGSCDTIDPGVPRLGVPAKQWLVETNSMAASQCYGAACATVFPSGLNLAASGNRTLWREKGRVVSDEMRALNNLAWHRADGGTTFSGLNGFGADINAPRDPRNGRIGELASEDPLLTGEYSVEYMRGMQEGDDPRYMKMTAAVKHFAGYSMETGRFTSVGNFSTFDLWDTYLIPYQMSFEQGHASGTMCSYISLGIDGGPYIPACANSYLLNSVTRKYWGADGAVHTSDCGAVQYMKNKGFTANDTYSAAAALNGGMDLNSNTILPLQLELAIDLGLTSESVLDASLTRTLALRFQLGQLDPLEMQPMYMAYGAQTIGAPENVAAAQEGSDTGLVLVKNDGATLPLKRGISIAVLGPLGVSNEPLLGDYYADAVCPGATGYSNTVGFGCVQTIAAALTAENLGGSTVAFSGVTINGGNDTSWVQALAAAASADAIVLTLGTDRSTAEEGTDLRTTSLPGLQSEFALAVLRVAAGKPVVFVLVSSFPMAFEEFAALTPAIVLAYTPGMGGAAAISRALFGMNRWGRAVLTHYPSAYTQAVTLNDFGMTPSPVNPGRTYRYYNGSAGEPLVVFGQGLSYNTLAVSCSGGLANASAISVTCNVTSISGPDGDQVLQVFHRVGADVVSRVGGAHPIPKLTLVDFTRFTLPSGATQMITFTLDPAVALTLTNSTGGTTQYAGEHFLDVFDGSANNETIQIELPADVYGRQPPLASSA